jgi:glutamate carboxypeptidase
VNRTHAATPSAVGLADAIHAAARRRRERMIADLADLTALDAPSGDAEALEIVASRVSGMLEREGAGARVHPGAAGPHLEARFGPNAGARSMVLCHYDTVWPRGTGAERSFELREGRAMGPGVFDMRAGIVAAFAALSILRELDAVARPVTVLLTADEETGANTSRELILELGRAASFTLVPEPPLPGGALKTSRRGCATYRLTVRGRSAHAGLDPGAGVSAIDELVDQLVAVRDIADPDRGTALNVGVLRGGMVANSVAEAAEADVDVRVATLEEEERVRAAIAALRARRPGAQVSARELQSRPPMERTDAIALAAARAHEIGARLGLVLEEGYAGGASDGCLLAAEGLSVLDGLGPEGGGAHAAAEWVSVGSMVDRAALYALLLAEL